MLRISTVPVFALVLLVATTPLAQARMRAAEGAAAEAKAQVAVPLIDGPLHLSDFKGMQPRAELRNKLGHVGGFVQSQPKDGEPATDATDVWMGRTKTTLYFVFLCKDAHPAQLRGHLARREDILYDDRVAVILDSFKDHRKGVEFMLNPVGVQADAEWTDNVNTDFSYDQVWDSEGEVTEGGWMALMAIPFLSLRYPADQTSWGVVFERVQPQNSEYSFWPRVAANVSGTLTQEGTLEDMHSDVHSHNLQVTPYTMGQSEHTLENAGTSYPGFSTRKAEATAGGDLKYILKNGLVLDATVNPDFSDTESDTPQFTVNQRYPVYYSELRPFFLEHANFFSTPLTLLYTRKVVNPEFGVRLTGKMGKTNLGLLTIDDRSAGRGLQAGDTLYGKRAFFAAGRVSEDLGKSSSVGLIYVDREFGGGWNRIGGIDFTAQLNPRWQALGQWVVSSTKGDKDSGTPPTYSAGPAAYLEIFRNGHAFNTDNYFQDYSKGFVTNSGYVQTNNFRAVYSHTTYQWYPKGHGISSIGLETSNQIAFDHDGNRVYHYSTFDPFLKLPRNTTLAIGGGQNSDTVGPQNGYSLKSNQNFTENFAVMVVRSSFSPQAYVNLQLIRSGNVNYNPATGAVPVLLSQSEVQFSSLIQPVHPLSVTSYYLLDRDFTDSGHQFVYESQTLRTKINYQFTRALSARIIAEYDTTLVNPQQTSLSRTKQIGTQALFAWLPHPGTAVYLGYNNDLQNIDHKLCNRLSSGLCDADNTDTPRSSDWLNDGRRFFFKASYQFRF